ncbi:alpha/beta hydrolase family protein [Novosphingobium resinovorum]
MLGRSLVEQLGDRKGFEAASPRRFAARADAPVLLIHGKDDTVVPYRQSLVMADALKDAGKPYELVTLAGEDHWLSREETRKQMLAAAMRFVQQHNPAE